MQDQISICWGMAPPPPTTPPPPVTIVIPFPPKNMLSAPSLCVHFVTLPRYVYISYSYLNSYDSSDLLLLSTQQMHIFIHQTPKFSTKQHQYCTKQLTNKQTRSQPKVNKPHQISKHFSKLFLLIYIATSLIPLKIFCRP